MGHKSYKATVPGSLMLFGEYAVLHGSKAVVCAVDCYINAILAPRSDTLVNISSSLGSLQFKLHDFKIVTPLQFVLTAIEHYLPKITTGFDLTITTDFSPQLGLGSSAAATVAAILVLEEWLSALNVLNANETEKLALVAIGREVIRAVQGIGSGADVAASVYGGVISYQAEPLEVEQLLHRPPLVAVYSGSKMPTVQVVAKVAKLNNKYEEVFSLLYGSMNACTKRAINCIKEQDWSSFGELMNIHQGLQDALGVNNEILAELIFDLRREPSILGAKISGSGLGDCVIGAGKLPDGYFPRDGKQVIIGVRQVQIFQ